ncbi:MAG: helix-turn-helix transcriptional regulator [SAR324 cluster bacterium]|nr:helix-turn-helix transcriptional regulator [SAR324 cluster bacterium]
METQSAANCMEALGNTTRLEIFRLLVRAGPNGAPVGRLQQRLGIPASTLSHHIARLVRVGLVSQERQSRVLICRAEYARMDALLGFLGAECCQGLGADGVSANEDRGVDCSFGAAAGDAARDAARDTAGKHSSEGARGNPNTRGDTRGDETHGDDTGNDDTTNNTNNPGVA